MYIINLRALWIWLFDVCSMKVLRPSNEELCSPESKEGDSIIMDNAHKLPRV